MVKRDLGPEAVILFTKKVKKGGVFGFMGTPVVEVTAGVDVLEQGFPETLAGPAESKPILKKASKQMLLEDDRYKRPEGGRVYSRPASAEKRQEVFQSELNEGKVLAGTASLRFSQETKQNSSHSLHPEVARYEKILLKNGVEEDVVKQVLNKVNDEILDRGYPRSGSMGQLLQRSLASMVKVSGPIEAIPGKTRVIALIGPTGVGKTTSLVKMASQYTYDHGLKVGLITADTYRIGAVEQLKIFRDIIDLPLEVANQPDEIPDALAKLSDRDLVFLDTAGRSPQNRRQIQDLRAFLEASKPAETHLVISATTKNSDLLPIVAKFGLVPINRFLFTKLDETKSYGLFLNLAAHFSIPVSYLSTGQKVPDDLESASPEKIAELVLGEAHGRPS